MNVTDLKEQYAILKAQLADVNAQITAVIKKNKRYNYSNVETTHSAETHSLNELRNMKRDIMQDITGIESQLTPPFVKIKNYQ